MSAPLYTVELLGLAVELAQTPLLSAPAATADRRSALCGSRITVQLTFDDGGAIEQIGLAVHACALGQASAALLARSIRGTNAEQLVDARDRLAAFLAGTLDHPGDWPGLTLLAAARSFPARHAAIRLPFEAAVEAARSAKVTV